MVVVAAAELSKRRGHGGLILAELTGIVSCWAPEDEAIAS